jgi:hypothetical protein
MMLTLKSGIEYCASPNENIDSDLIVQQLEIMKQLLELNYKKDSGLTEIKTCVLVIGVTHCTSTSNVLMSKISFTVL